MSRLHFHQVFFLLLNLPAVAAVSFDMPPSSSALGVSFNRALCQLFIDAFSITELRQKFRSRCTSVNIVQILRWIMRLTVQLAVEIRSIAFARFGKRNPGAAFKSVFGMVKSEVLHELGAEQERQVFRAALSATIRCDSDPRVADMFHIVFVRIEMSLT